MTLTKTQPSSEVHNEASCCLLPYSSQDLFSTCVQMEYSRSTVSF